MEHSDIVLAVLQQVNTRWVRRREQGGTWTIWLQTTRDILPGEQLIVQYNAARWCRATFHIDTLTAAIRTYDIDVTTSTEDSYGYWRGLPTDIYNELVVRQQREHSDTRSPLQDTRPLKRPKKTLGTLHAYLASVTPALPITVV